MRVAWTSAELTSSTLTAIFGSLVTCRIEPKMQKRLTAPHSVRCVRKVRHSSGDAYAGACRCCWCCSSALRSPGGVATGWWLDVCLLALPAVVTTGLRSEVKRSALRAALDLAAAVPAPSDRPALRAEEPGERGSGVDRPRQIPVLRGWFFASRRAPRIPLCSSISRGNVDTELRVPRIVNDIPTPSPPMDA